jgi:putative nucleotidyltransferase with HDIG domain
MQKVIEKIKKAIEGTEFEGKSFIAGGFVRDQVMGISSKDVDIVVNIDNGGVKLAQFLQKELGATEMVIFERFGTAQIVIDGCAIEFVMSRKEEYNEGSRKPEVCFGTLEDDVMRRDLTINSLLLNITTGEVLDLTGKGLSDINDRVIRTTNEPNFIFQQDPLRLMRAIRFAVRFDFIIENPTFSAIRDNASALHKISKERIQEEFMKILGSRFPVEGMRLLMEANLIDQILPELNACTGVSQNEFHTKDVLEHIFDVVNNTEPTAMHRLAALLHDISKPECKTVGEDGKVHFFEHHVKSADFARKFMTDLKFSGDQIDLVFTVIREHMLFMDEKSRNRRVVRRWRMKLGEEKMNFLLDLMKADVKSSTDPRVSWVEEIRNMVIIEKPIVVLPVNGDDIMQLFNIKPGPKVKELKDKVIDWICEEPELTKEEIVDRLHAVWISE